MATNVSRPDPKFMNLLQVNESEVEEILNHPVGHFRGIVSKIEFGTIKSKDHGGGVYTVEFNMQSQEPLGDVDPDEWERYRATPKAKRDTLRAPSIYIDPASPSEGQRRAADFMIKKLGQTSGMSLQDMLEASQGAPCAYEVKHETGKKSGEPYATIARVLNVDEAGPSQEG
jgi:hypothetical protein